jgi:hypothetical protein
VDVEPVDPRDTEWESDQPSYRVHFWGRSSASPEIRGSMSGNHSREYRIRGAEDVYEVIRWANGAASSLETYTLYVESTNAGHWG